MSQSQLFAIMVGGTASVAGSVLVGYASIGIESLDSVEQDLYQT